MAAQRRKSELNKVAFWTKPASSQAESIVPGVNDLGNLRPRVRGGHTKEIRAVMPVVQPKIESLNLQNPKTISLVSSKASPSLQDTVSTCVSTAKDKGVSLRNLCVEDKKRVASLIKELARLGEEKENAEKNLEEERKLYEKQILSLVAQQEQILTEFEEQKKLLEYQASILKLQQEQQRDHLQKHSPEKISQCIKPVIKISQNSSAVISSRYGENVAHPENVPLTDITKAREEDLLHTQRDKWRRNLYVNDTRDDGIEACSIQVHASSSPLPELDSAKIPLQRPFTAIIDKELANQRQLLEATTEHVKYLSAKHSGYNVVERHESKMTATDLEANKKAQSPNQNRAMFMQNMTHFDSPNMKSAHRQADQHRAMKVLLSQNHPIVKETSQPDLTPGHRENNVYNLGQGNRHLSPEKNEIIARFMQSQAEHELHKAGDHADVAGHAQIENNIQAHPKVKRRRPPPRSYGPLHAPVMSSTQKSSEFGDTLSVNSTMLVNHSHQKMTQQHVDGGQVDQQNIRQHVDGGDVDQIRLRSYQQQNLNNSNNNNRNSKVVDQDKKRSKLDQETEVNIVSPHRAGRHSIAGIDKHFLNKYKQMSAIERKTELQKQRYLLLVEQAKLRKILADKQDQLRVQIQATVTPEKQVNLDNDDGVNYEMSLLQLEEELARKEQELIKARELLKKKRQGKPRSELDPERGKSQQKSTSATSGNIDAFTNKLQSKADDQTGCGQGSVRSELASRVEPRVSPHYSTVLGHKYKQQARESPDKEVITRNINMAASETNQELSPPEEKCIKGQDGDACTVYSNNKVKDIVKKLDYSLHSDTEGDVEVQAGIVEQRSSPAGRVHVFHAEHMDMPATVSIVKTSTPTVDVNTSISYIHIPSAGADITSGQPRQTTRTEMMSEEQRQTTGTDITSGEQRQTTGTEKQKVHLSRLSDRNSRRDSYSPSPVEDTLSVVEIIKTLSETAPVSRWRPLEHVHLSRSLNDNSSQHNPGTSKERHTNKSRYDIPTTFVQDELAWNGTFSKEQPILEDLKIGQLDSLSQSKTSSPLPQRDPVLELFELKASGRHQDRGVVIENGGSLADLIFRVSSSEDEMDEDLVNEGIASSEDDNPARIIHTLRDSSDVDIVKRTQRQEFAVNDGDFSFEQNDKVESVHRNVYDISGHGTENVVELGFVPCDEEESLILEEVFFVQS